MGKTDLKQLVLNEPMKLIKIFEKIRDLIFLRFVA
jgi:hypothetical protein